MARYTEVQKVFLLQRFKKMLEEGNDYSVTETAELEGLGSLEPVVVRKTFSITVKESF